MPVLGRCLNSCLDKTDKACGCTDLACSGPTPPGEQHNRRWAVYEMPPGLSAR
ncbi:unnamed protein product [Choristocarpus tenellus]